MIRWVAFDDDTAEAVISRFKRGAAEIQHGDPLSAALGSNGPSLLVLPSDTPGRVMLAQCRQVIPPAEVQEEPVAYETTGFLGLGDAPVYRQPAQAEVPSKKKWWQRRNS